MSDEDRKYSQYEFSPIEPNARNPEKSSCGKASQSPAWRQWIQKNLTLVVTLSGVIIGVIEGNIA